MPWWRQRRLVRTIVIALLLWTAADLSNASLCALENEGTGAFQVSTGTTLLDSSDGQVPAQVPHVDDCFCCSHCVEVQPASPAALSIPVEMRRAAVLLAAPRVFGSPLYHPPLA